MEPPRDCCWPTSRCRGWWDAWYHNGPGSRALLGSPVDLRILTKKTLRPQQKRKIAKCYTTTFCLYQTKMNAEKMYGLWYRWYYHRIIASTTNHRTQKQSGPRTCDDARDEMVLQIRMWHTIFGSDKATHLKMIWGSNASSCQHP